MTGPKGLSPPGNIDPRLKQLLDGLTEKTEVGAGERGNPLDRYIKVGDLIELGYAKVLGRVGQRLVSGGNLVSTDAPNTAIPPRPTGFTVYDGFDHVFLEWDPPLTLYTNHAYTEIYRNTVDNLSNAVLVATSTSFAWADLNVQYGVTYYYWIRFRSAANVVGPFNDTVGTAGQSAQDPAELLERLSGQITETELYADLNARIDLIDGPDSLAGSVAQRILQEAIDRAAAIAAEATARDAAIASAVSYLETYADDDSASAVLLDQLITVFGGNVANALTYTVAEVDSDLAVSTTFTSLQAQITALDGDLASYASITYVDEAVADEASARASAISVVSTQVGTNTASIATQATSISGLEAKYTVKIDVNGHVAGYGLATTSNDYDDEIHSTMLFSVDTFAIASPGATTMSFVVDSGSVVMSGAFIQDATITGAKILNASITNAKIVDGTILSAKIADANITTAKIQDLAVTNAKIANATIQSAKIQDAAITSAKINDAAITSAKIANTIQSTNYDPGVDGWQILKSGAAEFNDVVITRPNIVASGTYTRPTTTGSDFQDDYYVIDEFTEEWGPDFLYIVIDTGYNNTDDVFNVAGGSFLARAKCTEAFATWGGGGPGVSKFYDIAISATPRFSIEHYSSSISGPNGGRVYLELKIPLPTNIHVTINTIRIDEIEWALMRLT